MRRGSQWLSEGAEKLGEECQRAARRAGDDSNRNGGPAAFSASGDGHVDLLIIGSGYGGAVAALRLAESAWASGDTAASAKGEPPKLRKRIVVLERGLEWQPGDFPRSLAELPMNVRFTDGTSAQKVHGMRDSLFDVRMGEDMSVLVGSGLGGGSLINAGVAEEADAATLDDPAWPKPWRGNAALWQRLYERSRRGLAAEPWRPLDTAKDHAMAALGERLNHSAGRWADQCDDASRRIHARPVCLTIQNAGQPVPGGPTDDPPTGPAVRGCIGCGDCFAGCNVGAKRTLGTTYLLQARRRGVQLYTGGSVLRLRRAGQRADDGWHVEWRLSDPGRMPGGQKEPFVLTARRVILAAGTLGSTEILMRSHGDGLRLSSALGAGFSGNSDLIGAMAGLQESARCWVDETQAPIERQIGPTITHQIAIDRDAEEPSRRTVVQDLVAPGPLGWFYTELLTSLMVPQRWLRPDWSSRRADSPDTAVVDRSPTGFLQHSLLLTAFGHDGAAGRLVPPPGQETDNDVGRLVVHWPDAGNTASLRLADARLAQATPSGAAWLRNPLWQAVPDTPLLDKPKRHRMVSVHPLGGSRMSADMRSGVVDAWGRVFDAGTTDPAGPPGRQAHWSGREDQRFHDGLVVIDGSIVPTSLGINPLLTITALAEGITEKLAADWCSDDARTASPRAAPMSPEIAPLAPWVDRDPMPVASPAPTAFKFDERMTGPLYADLQPHAPLDATKAPSESKDMVWYRLNLAFDFAAVPDLQAFLTSRRKLVDFKAAATFVGSSFDPQKRRQQDTPVTSEPIELTGTVEWFAHEPGSLWGRWRRALCGWYDMRGDADLARLKEKNRRRKAKGEEPEATPLKLFLGFAAGLTHFGAPRLLVYRFAPLKRDVSLTLSGRTRDNAPEPPRGPVTVHLPAGTRLEAHKSLVYEAGCNPWDQLTEMPLEAVRPRLGRLPLATLVFDPLHMLSRDELPLKLMGQNDGITGLRDTLSLALYFGRVMLQQHLLSFRYPDHAARRPPQRLPQPWPADDDRFKGLVLTVHPVGGWPGHDTTHLPDLRLTRIRQASPTADARQQPPLVLLHGLGSGGVQFTHPAIRMPMAQCLAREGFDVWVGELRTSIGFQTHESQWTMDDVALNDVPRLVDAVRKAVADETGHPVPQVDVVAHCIGSAMLWMALLKGRLRQGDDHPRPDDSTVRRIVSMQVGPLVHMPRGNRVRGFIANRLQDMLRLPMAQASVDDGGGDADVAVDRLLNTFPTMGGYDPLAWFEPVRDRHPDLKIGADLVHNARLTNVHRSAGVFAQLFQWPNMNDPVLLDALPDLLGGVNLTTYQQTAQYTFLEKLADQVGGDAYVTDAHVNTRLQPGMAVLFVQGQRNDVFHERGTWKSERLIRRVKGAAFPVGRLLLQRDDRKGVPDYGHLDAVCGLQAATHVFRPMADFLRNAALPVAVKGGSETTQTDAPASPWNFAFPAIGPWIGDARWEDGRLRLRLGLRTAEDRGLPPTLACVWVHRGSPQVDMLGFIDTAKPGGMGEHRFCHQGECAVELEVPDVVQRDASGLPWQLWVCAIERAGAALTFEDAPELLREPSDAQTMLNDWVKTRRERAHPAHPEASALLGAIQLDPVWLSGQLPNQPLRFALTACRAAPVLTDRGLADAVHGDLLRRLDPLALVLAVGDQVYSDSLSITGSGGRTALRFFDAFREAYSAPFQRQVMARRPVYMAADDHEFINDHHDAVRVAHQTEWRHAREALWYYEYAAGPLGRERANHDADRWWYSFDCGGHRFFVADTRNRRADGCRMDRDDAKIMDDSQFTAIDSWLARHAQTDSVKFLVLPTPLAPLDADSIGPPEYAVRADNWGRYPKSIARLLDIILHHAPRRLVLLSGDYHCFVDVTLTLRQRDRPDEPDLRLRQIVTSGMYSPFEFVNTRFADLYWPATDEWLPAGPVDWRYELTHPDGFSPANGYVELQVQANGDVDAEFIGRAPGTTDTAHLEGHPDPDAQRAPAASHC